MTERSQLSVAELIKTVPEPVRPIVQAARRAMRDAAPEAEETVYMPAPPRAATYMWKLLRYRLNGAKLAGIGTFTRHSTVFFDRGRQLDDPEGLLQGSGKESRFITLRSPADAQQPALRRLIKQAVQLSKREVKRR